MVRDGERPRVPRSDPLDKNALPELLFAEHHQSHAASAFYPSPFERAAILCMDGVGEWATTSAWLGDGRELEAEIQPLHVAGLAHDIGKAGLSPSMLLKPGELDMVEWSFVQAHPHIGNWVCRELLDASRAAVFVRNALIAAWHNADQAEANVRRLVVTDARADDGDARARPGRYAGRRGAGAGRRVVAHPDRGGAGLPLVAHPPVAARGQRLRPAAARGRGLVTPAAAVSTRSQCPTAASGRASHPDCRRVALLPLGGVAAGARFSLLAPLISPLVVVWLLARPDRPGAHADDQNPVEGSL